MKSRVVQRGQALTEFLVLAFVLLPLFLLIPLIGKYQDISHTAQMASRYVAFEAMTRNYNSDSGWKPEAELADDVRRRFFGNPDAPVKTQEGADDARVNQNLFWRDPQDNSLIKAINTDVTVNFGPTHGSTHSAAFSTASDNSSFNALGISHALGLEAKGIYTAGVNVSVANVPDGLKFYEPFDKINLVISRGTSILIDPWTAKSPAQIESKITAHPALFPVSSLAGVSSSVDASVAIIDLPGGLSGPKLGKLDFWTDVVPVDRLKTR